MLNIPQGSIFNKSINEIKSPYTFDTEFSDLELKTINLINDIQEKAFDIECRHLQSIHVYLKESNDIILEEAFNDFIINLKSFINYIIKYITTIGRASYAHMSITARNYLSKISQYDFENVDIATNLDNFYMFTPHVEILKINKIRDYIDDFYKYTEKFTIPTSMKQYEIDSKKLIAKISIVSANSISYHDFIKFTNSVYRNGYPYATIVDVSSGTLIDALHALKTMDKTLSRSKKFQTELIKVLTLILNVLDIKIHDITPNINEFYTIKFAEIREIVKCMSYVYMEHLRVLEDSMRQNIRIINKCTSIIDGKR